MNDSDFELLQKFLREKGGCQNGSGGFVTW
jgi:hypothetical protein